MYLLFEWLYLDAWMFYMTWKNVPCVCMYSCTCTHTDLHTLKMQYYLRVYETIHNIKMRLPTRLDKSPSATKIMWLKTNPIALNLMPHQVKGNCFLVTVWWITEGSASIMKGIMVKQPVKVDHTEVCPGISEIFFFSDWARQTEVENLVNLLSLDYEGHSLKVNLNQILWYCWWNMQILVAW